MPNTLRPSMNESLFRPLDVTSRDAERFRTNTGLPPAGFRVSHVGVSRGAIGMFTSLRADPSWT
jgi:hypothetical protein